VPTFGFITFTIRKTEGLGIEKERFIEWEGNGKERKNDKKLKEGTCKK